MSNKKARYFIAGAGIDCLPGMVDNILFNLPNNAADDKSLELTQATINRANADKLFLDSGGFALHMIEEGEAKFESNKDKERTRRVINSDPNRPVHYINNENKKVINLHPVHLVNAAIDLQPDMLISLDYPLRKTLSRDERDVEFHRKLYLNVKWTKETSELLKPRCPEIKLYVPIQIFTLKQFYEFYRQIENVQYDGFSMPFRGISHYELVDLMKLYSKLGINMFHLLGVASYRVLAISAYMGYNLFDTMSWDATTWRRNAERQIYSDHRNLESIPFNESKPNAINELIKTCPCPWCKRQSVNNLIYITKQERVSFFRCHNFWTTERIALELYQYSRDYKELQRYIKGNNSHKLEKTKDIINLLTYADIILNY